MPTALRGRRFDVGILEIDAQHAGLANLLDELEQSIQRGASAEDRGALLDELIEQAMTHFETEEQLMENRGYPKLLQHREMHRHLTDSVLAFRRDLDAGRVALTVRLLDYLREWALIHTQTMDRDFADFVRRSPGH